MDELAIKLEHISKSFKMKESVTFKFDKSSSRQKNILKVLDDVSFEVKKGEILGIIGKNGSGKSTLLRIIAGVYKPDKGSLKINGRLSPMMQIGIGFQKNLPAKDNIITSGMLLGLSKSHIESKVNSIIKYAELEEFRNMPIKNYSTGMRARLAFATSMQIDPDIFLIDEILSVGDKDFQKKSYETFLKLKKNNKTVLHATHSLSKLSEFSDRALLLSKGKVIMIGDPEEVIKKYQNPDKIN